MRISLLVPLIPLVALSLSACDTEKNARRLQQEQAELSAPCIAAVQAEVARNAGSDFRGFKLYYVLPREMAPGNYAVQVKYQEITPSSPSGGIVRRLDCELRDGQVVSLYHPGPI